ncbi:MAG TPA: VWA domain-containing protein [Candidatus Angelobacter sp.]|nr:VWA domain-containing protein [Candidatus Angelobacter sp.]
MYLATPATVSRGNSSRLCFIFCCIAITFSFVLLCASALVAQQGKPTLQDKTQPAPQQQPPQQPDDQSVTTIKKQVNVVNVLATVRNKDGKIVSTLNKEDFQLEVDGKPQAIRYFSRVTDTPLTLGLLVDTSLSVRRVLDKERTASYVFLNDLLNETKDKAFVMHFDFEVELLQDLTSSRPKLENALQKLQVGNPRQIQTSDPNDPNQQGGGQQRGGGTKLYDAVFLASDEITGKVQGRKALIILSDGVDQGSKVGMGRAIEAAQRADTLVYTILFVDKDANNNNVAGNPGGHHGGYPGGGYPGGGYPGGRHGGGYPGGGYPGGGYPGGGGGNSGGGGGRGGNGSFTNGKEVMKQLALQTGGRFFEVSKKESIDDIYKTIGEELRNQYSLGFTPELASDKEGDFHKIALTTTQKDMTVQAREGYYSGK